MSAQIDVQEAGGPARTQPQREPFAAAGRLVGTYGEARIVLAFAVQQKAVEGLLPAGWTSCPLATGPATGANVTVSFIDQLFVRTADGRPRDTSPICALGIPAKQTAAGDAAVMVFAGFASNPDYAPGVYGNFLLARPHIRRSVVVDASGTSRARESWEFTSEEGEAVLLDLHYRRGAPTTDKREAKIRSVTIPGLCRLYKIEQAVDVVHSAVAGIDRVESFRFQASGSRLSRLFDAVDRPISIVANPWYTRQVLLVSDGRR